MRNAIPRPALGSVSELDSVSGLAQPGLGNWLESAEHSSKLGALEDASGDSDPSLAVGSVDGHCLEVGLLPAVLVGSAELPRRVAMPDVLGSVG